MVDEIKRDIDIASALDGLRRFFPDDQFYGRMFADLHDLIEAGDWLVQQLSTRRAPLLSEDEVEDFLISIEAKYVEHAMFHLNSLASDIRTLLEGFDNNN